MVQLTEGRGAGVVGEEEARLAFAGGPGDEFGSMAQGGHARRTFDLAGDEEALDGSIVGDDDPFDEEGGAVARPLEILDVGRRDGLGRGHDHGEILADGDDARRLLGRDALEGGQNRDQGEEEDLAHRRRVRDGTSGAVVRDSATIPSSARGAFVPAWEISGFAEASAFRTQAQGHPAATGRPQGASGIHLT